MTSFEKHLGRHMLPSEGQEEIEYYVRKILSKKELQEREKMRKQVKPKQLKLF